MTINLFWIVLLFCCVTTFLFCIWYLSHVLSTVLLFCMVFIHSQLCARLVYLYIPGTCSHSSLLFIILIPTWYLMTYTARSGIHSWFLYHAYFIHNSRVYPSLCIMCSVWTRLLDTTLFCINQLSSTWTLSLLFYSVLTYCFLPLTYYLQWVLLLSLFRIFTSIFYLLHHWYYEPLFYPITFHFLSIIFSCIFIQNYQLKLFPALKWFLLHRYF